MHLQTCIYVFKYWEEIQAESQDGGSLQYRQKEAREEGNYINFFTGWSKLSFPQVNQWTRILVRAYFLCEAWPNHYTDVKYLWRKKETIEAKRKNALFLDEICGWCHSHWLWWGGGLQLSLTPQCHPHTYLPSSELKSLTTSGPLIYGQHAVSSFSWGYLRGLINHYGDNVRDLRMVVVKRQSKEAK